MLQSLSNEVSNVQPAHHDSTESTDPSPERGENYTKKTFGACNFFLELNTKLKILHIDLICETLHPFTL